jgi:hypothetical protein
MVIKKTKSFCDEIKVTDKCTFFEGSNTKLHVILWSVQVLSANVEYLVVQQLSGAILAGLIKFYCINASVQGILVEGSKQSGSGQCKEGSGQNVSFIVLTVCTDGALSIFNPSNETTEVNISEAS